MVNKQPNLSTSSKTTEHDSSPVIKLDILGKLIWEKRNRERLTLQEAANQSGVSIATLSRLERTHNLDDEAKRDLPTLTPSTKTLSAITIWLEVLIDQFFESGIRTTELENANSIDTMGKIEAHLRADPKLKPEDVRVLNQMFRAIYNDVSKEDKSSFDT